MPWPKGKPSYKKGITGVWKMSELEKKNVSKRKKEWYLKNKECGSPVANNGGHHSLETRMKIRKSLLKKFGFRTPTNTLIRRSVQYINWRKSVFERDNYTCQECKKIGGKLHVDHIKPFSDIISELRKEFGTENLYSKALECLALWDTNNGRTLCVDCHKKTDTYLINRKK